MSLDQDDPSAVPEIDVAWLAGLLEGEGTFYVNYTNARRYNYPKIAVNMTDQDVIARAAALFGTSIYTMPMYTEGKQQWKAQCSGERAARWMRRLRPYLGERRGAKVDEILAAYDQREPAQIKRRRSCQLAAAARAHDASGRFVSG